MKNSKRIITENQAEILPHGESSLAWHPSRHPTTAKWKAVWGGDRPQSCTVSGRSWVRLYEVNHLAYLKSHFLPSFTHAHSKTKGNVSEVKFLAPPPPQKGLFQRRGREGKTKKETKDLEQSTGGLALVLRNAASVLSAAQLPLQVLRPLGAPEPWLRPVGPAPCGEGLQGDLAEGKKASGSRNCQPP